ncbi:MAG: MerR family transcriptional regulator [Ginsengibacter sp.]
MALSQINFEFDADPATEKGPLKTVRSHENITGALHADGVSEEQKLKSKRGRKSLKQVNAVPDNIEVPEDDILFQKQYYSMGDVALMFKENTSLIRFWENEFDILTPKKNKKGDRFFRPEDVKNLKLIHYLIRERKYTMEGAKEFLKNNKFAGEKHEMIESLEKIKLFLLELKNNL